MKEIEQNHIELKNSQIYENEYKIQQRKEKEEKFKMVHNLISFF